MSAEETVQVLRKVGEFEALNGGYPLSEPVREVLTATLLRFPSARLVEMCVDDTLAYSKALPKPSDLTDWLEANLLPESESRRRPPWEDCTLCEGTGWQSRKRRVRIRGDWTVVDVAKRCSCIPKREDND